MSSGSLVAIRSPALAIATTVASTASPLPALPKRTPHPDPEHGPPALRRQPQTPRLTRDRRAWAAHKPDFRTAEEVVRRAFYL
jgi:hypothetical protein